MYQQEFIKTLDIKKSKLINITRFEAQVMLLLYL